MADQTPSCVEMKKYTLYRRARKTGRCLVWDLYKKQRNFAKNCNINPFLNVKGANSKNFWSTVCSLNKSASSIPTLEHGSVTATADKERAELLNSFFSQCFNRSVQPLKPKVHHILMNQYCAHQRVSITYYWKLMYLRPLTQTVSPEEC